MIGEVVPPARDLATRHDLAELKTELKTEIAELRIEIVDLRGEMREGFATLRGEIKASARDTMRWMLGFFIPVWAGTWAAVLAIVLKG